MTFKTSSITILFLEEGLYEEKEFTGTEQIFSSTFPEIALTVEQILAAGNIS